jgi:transposase
MDIIGTLRYTGLQVKHERHSDNEYFLDRQGAMQSKGSVGNHFRPYNPEQSFLFPPSPMQWLPEGHLAYFILEIVQTLDLAEIEGVYAKRDARGEHAYSPRMLLAVLIYGYCVGVFSSRRIARALYEDVAFRVLSGGEQPHFTRISDFRMEHRQALAGLFLQVLKLCQRAGLVKLGHVSLDGTKILASASKHKAMSYERMKKEEARLRAEIDACLQRRKAPMVSKTLASGSRTRSKICPPSSSAVRIDSPRSRKPSASWKKKRSPHVTGGAFVQSVQCPNDGRRTRPGHCCSGFEQSTRRR